MAEDLANARIGRHGAARLQSVDSSERYGDLMTALISIVGRTRARRLLQVWSQARSGKLDFSVGFGAWGYAIRALMVAIGLSEIAACSCRHPNTATLFAEASGDRYCRLSSRSD